MRLLIKFFFFTYSASWICFISVAVLSHNASETSPIIGVLQSRLALLGTIAPALVALWLIKRAGIPGQMETLLSRIGKWNLNIKWYLFAAGYIAIIKLFVALIHRGITGVWPQFGHEVWYIMVIVIIFSTWVQAGEEIG